MEIILEIIVPVFGIVGIGYAAARTGLFPPDAAKGLSAFVFDFAIPAPLFPTMFKPALPPPIDWATLSSDSGAPSGPWFFAPLTFTLLSPPTAPHPPLPV